MSEYYFIRQRGEGSPKVGIPEDFVNRAFWAFSKGGCTVPAGFEKSKA